MWNMLVVLIVAALEYCQSFAHKRIHSALYGFTTRSGENPKLLMARAAAPMLSGLRVETGPRRVGRIQDR